METSDILILIAIGVLAVAIFYKDKMKKDDNKSAVLLQNQMKEINRTVQKQYEESMKIVKDSVKGLTKMEENQRQVADVGKQIEGLQNILRNPKQRGMLGEYRLETLLQNVFSPKEYKMQYKFNDGDIVDAVIFIGDKIIPIDSKFSLENYNRIVEETDTERREELEKVFKQDLKKRIDETAKYIRPDEGTTEYAFMFIPAEGIFYDLLNNEVGAIKSSTRDLIEYAINDKKVFITSPTTFYAYLQSMLQSARDFRIQESTKEILKNVSMLGRHLEAYHEHYNKVGDHLGTVINAYNKSVKEFGKIDKDVTKLTGESVGVESQLLEKPVSKEEV